ncbi:MAG: acetyltransferase [Desulfuromonadales bacterium]|nr:acetyltransferase [Desulfuromonadales bacterium]
MKDLIVVGGGGFAKEVIWLAQDCGFNVIGALDDAFETSGEKIYGVELLGKVSDWTRYKECSFVVAIGAPRTRATVVEKMKNLGDPDFATLIHPSVKKSESVNVREGTIICAGTILTVDIEVGSHVILNLNVTVGHESVIGDFVTVAPMVAVSGNVSLDDCVEVGTGASIRQGIRLHRGSMLGMGSVLTKVVPENVIFAGVPAKKLKELPEV